MSTTTWFITGTSRGFGREWAGAALERGDSVAATARDAGSLDALVTAHGDAVLSISLFEAPRVTRAALRSCVPRASGHILRVSPVSVAAHGHQG